MKYSFIALAVLGVSLIIPFNAHHAHALSCLPVDMYLQDIVSNEDVVIFTGTVTDQIQEDTYTAEVITVQEVLQGYAQTELFLYHTKDATWGYMCNAGPAKDGETSLYVASQDASGMFTAHQRLAVDDPLVATLKADLEEAEIQGSHDPLTKEDRMNQLMTNISDLFAKINILFKEYLYLKMQ